MYDVWTGDKINISSISFSSVPIYVSKFQLTKIEGKFACVNKARRQDHNLITEKPF